MKFDPPLDTARLLRRYKRFLADLELADGSRFTVHCPNTGAMIGCDAPGSVVWYSDSGNPKRKYRCTLEVVVTAQGRVGVNTGRTNALVREALQGGGLAPFAGMTVSKAEAAIPDEAGRFDFLLTDERDRPCYLEVKSMTLCDDTGRGSFPDAVSERAVKHVRALMRRAAAGDRAAMLFCAQHTGISRATLADEIHPAYGTAVREAMDTGVEVYAFGCTITPEEIRIDGALEFDAVNQRARAENVSSV